jgi:hypothetical protein
VVPREQLLAAYERFNQRLGPGRHVLASFVAMGPDYEGGALLITLDAGESSAEADAAAIRSWAVEIAPVAVDVTVEQDAPRARPLPGRP